LCKSQDKHIRLFKNLMYKSTCSVIYKNEPFWKARHKCSLLKFFFFFAHKELYPLAKKYNNLCNMSDMTVWEKMAWQLPNKPYTVIISTQWFQITWKKKLLKIYATKSFTDHRSHSNPILYYICFSDPARKIQHKSVSLKTDGGYQYWPNEDPSNLYFEHNINDNNHWKTKVVFTSSCIDNILGDLHSSDIACH